ncbi:hypothetical protein WICPIJ_005314 [Wickerhamomyces pijperi]|uniref:Uncharacterized protein n=1 Tax=Wickerhamomyces pijperi TaxID=599730 RepID=A0A9P8Q5Y7_WICPI|nr:hypothetical protein WICPIJ_005314 [Wickerhamomyces pijperi]
MHDLTFKLPAWTTMTRESQVSFRGSSLSFRGRVLCHLEEDSYEHLLFQCSMSQHCWKNVINGSSSTADLTKDDWDSIDGNYSSEELIDLSQYVHCLMELRHARRMSSKKIDNFSVSQVESEFIQLLSQKQFEYSFRE